MLLLLLLVNRLWGSAAWNFVVWSLELGNSNVGFETCYCYLLLLVGGFCGGSASFNIGMEEVSL